MTPTRGVTTDMMQLAAQIHVVTPLVGVTSCEGQILWWIEVGNRKNLDACTKICYYGLQYYMSG